MSEQFCLRWNNHQSTLISVFETLLESGSLIDCTLCAEGQLLKAHKVVLSACSPIFESMLCIQEDKHPIIFLKDVKFIELKAMLDYMYKGEVNILQDQLDSFLRTAAALQIKGLTDQGGGGGDEPPAKKGPGRKTGMSDVAPESPLVGNAPLREGSVSPTRRRRRIPRRPSSAEDASADNSCDIPPPAVAPPAITPATGALPVSEPLHRSSLSATTVKAKQEPIDTPLVTPKQEFVEETNEEIEDLTLDDDDDYHDSMSDMSKPGTSFGAMNPGSTSQQDFSQWQQMMGAADRSGTDEVFMAAQEAINNQTNTQAKRKNEGKGLTSLVVEIDERDNTKRIYWVKNEDLTTEIASTTDKKEVQATDEQFEGNLDDEDVNIFDMTTPMKRFNRYDDEECVPSGEEKRLIKMPKTVGQIVKKKSVGQEGHDLKFADITSVYTKPKGGKHFTDDRGYVYYQHSTTPFKRQLKCVFANVAKFKCQTTASMALDPPDSRIVISSKSNPHNHPPENEKTIASRFSRCLKKRVLEEPDVPVKQIYDDEKEKCPLGAEFLPKNIALQRMRRYRRVHMRSLQGQSLKTEPISDDEVPGDSTELELYSEGKVIYVDAKGYQYSQQFASVYKRQLRCVRARKIASERCPARASMLLQPRYSPIKILRRHNHDPEDIDRTIFYYTLKQRAKDEKDKSLRIIYDEEVKRNPESAASFCHPFSKAKQAMQRARKRSYEDQNCSLNDAESIQSDSPQRIVSEMSITGNYFATVSNSRQSAILDSPLVSYRHQPARDAPPVSIQHSSSQADLVSTRLADDVTDDLSKNVVLQQILIDSGQQLSGSKVFYECPYCKRLFDKEGSLDQHMLDEHVNSFVIDDESLPDKSDNT